MMLAATYQFIYREEAYYQPPTYIYNSRYGYAADGEKLVSDSYVPVIDRYAGQDEMLTNAHLFSINIAAPLTGKLDAGLGFNTVSQERDGSYGNLNSDQYSTSADQDWFSQYSIDKKQDYSHIDLNGGLRYKINDALQAGIKLGYLTGEADQKLNKTDTSLYLYDYDQSNWNRSVRSGISAQDWKHDGHDLYGSLQLNYRLSAGRQISFSLSQNEKETDLRNSSVINDTSFYSGHWEGSNSYSDYLSHSLLDDKRTGSGKSEQSQRQLRLSLKTRESSRATIYVGVYLLNEKTTTSTDEPVVSRQHSFSSSDGWWTDSNGDTSFNHYTYIYRQDEDKRLVWKYVSERQSLQIPVFVEYQVSSNWQFMFGINRVWNRWEIEDQTTAYFTRRVKNDNGVIKTETNFGERYTEPRQILTDNTTDFVTGLKVDLSPTFSINLLVDPQFEPEWRVAQWWLGFKLGL